MKKAIINWTKVIGTLFFFNGAVTRVELMYAPRTITLVIFILALLYIVVKTLI